MKSTLRGILSRNRLWGKFENDVLATLAHLEAAKPETITNLHIQYYLRHR